MSNSCMDFSICFHNQQTCACRHRQAASQRSSVIPRIKNEAIAICIWKKLCLILGKIGFICIAKTFIIHFLYKQLDSMISFKSCLFLQFWRSKLFNSCLREDNHLLSNDCRLNVVQILFFFLFISTFLQRSYCIFCETIINKVHM